MFPTHIALVPEYAGFDTRELLLVAAAIQKQIARDVAPLWNVAATVAPFESLDDLPMGYWPVIVTLRALDGQDGTHLDANGAPYALVEAQPHWSLAASHECIEMVLDPFGNRTVSGPSPTGGSGRVELLLEACDPCQGDDCAYLVDDVLVADFVTPAYFAAETRGARYCYSGRITQPLGLLPGGYLSWHDPATGSWWQRSMERGVATDLELGPLDGAGRDQRSVREMVDGFTRHHRRIAQCVSPERIAQAKERALAGRLASASKARRLRDRVRALSSLKTDPPPARRPFTIPPSPRATPPSAPSPELEGTIRAAIDELTSKPGLPDRDEVLETLTRALKQAQATAASTNKLLRSSATVGPEERELAIVQSAMHTPLAVPSRSLLTGKEVVGFSQYSELDFRWIATVWNHIFRSTVPFPVAVAPGAVVSALPRTATIAIAGDWATGDESSRRIATEIAKRKPTHTIHLGDVYYSGTESEETDHLLALWPRGSVASFTLNSNHEMYSGGHGYFGVALTSEMFAAQKGSSYFALVNDDWVILGLDTAYAATEFFQNGALNDAQLAWLRQIRAEIGVRDGGRKKVMVLSHHEGRSLAGAPKALWNQVTQALEVGPDYWYWGHEHGVAVFHPVTSGGVEVRGRLVGHGGVPYIADPTTAALEWTEDGTVGVGEEIDPKVPGRSPNGFAVLTIDGPNIAEELWDERGLRRWPRS